eukprot:CAMPEP_0182482006 /NCGR_PEP_ID=MMETSP1319-20130603/38350_1 /TAXON_ID=172717 /ORGANISM="Bolidomonas pacifica, Strain RCC208" /LENGTH=360 /DNA_ID=CAMNT_0024683681 /DNA_START=227 /DNA_END=1305 /DNA_ORIENTATION=-
MSRRVEADILARLEAENSEELNTPPFKEAKEKISALRSELRSSSRIRHIVGDPSFDLDLRDWGKIMKGVVDEGHTYLSAPWLTAEFYVYRRVVEAFDYFNPSSPTYRFDPFLKQKLAGLESSVGSAEALLSKMSSLASGRDAASVGLRVAVLSALWGNKMDLSIWPASSGDAGADVFSAVFDAAADSLLRDDTDRVAALLAARAGKARVHIVVDNAGFELVTDLALADYLVTSGLAESVTFQLKAHPTFVSDAMASDLMSTVRHLGSLPPSTHPSCRECAARWSDHLAGGRWRCEEDLYWAQPRAMWDMPEGLRAGLREGSDLCIVKGDANYRRLLGDRGWDYVKDSFEDVVGSYFPCPV